MCCLCMVQTLRTHSVLYIEPIPARRPSGRAYITSAASTRGSLPRHSQCYLRDRGQCCQESVLSPVRDNFAPAPRRRQHRGGAHAHTRTRTPSHYSTLYPRYVFVSGYHGSGTTFVATLLSDALRDRDREHNADPLAASLRRSVRGFSTANCFKHVARGWNMESSPRSCTGAPEDEGELLQNIWPRWVERVGKLSVKKKE